MKQYDIEIEELLRRVVRVKANNFDEALNIVSDKVDSSEIVLTPDDYVERDIRNLNSQKLTKELEITIKYNPSSESLKISNNESIEENYSCKTVSHIKSSINTYIADYIENNEIEAQKDNELDEIEREMIIE